MMWRIHLKMWFKKDKKKKDQRWFVMFFFKSVLGSLWLGKRLFYESCLCLFSSTLSRMSDPRELKTLSLVFLSFLGWFFSPLLLLFLLMPLRLFLDVYTLKSNKSGIFIRPFYNQISFSGHEGDSSPVSSPSENTEERRHFFHLGWDEACQYRPCVQLSIL